MQNQQLLDQNNINFEDDFIRPLFSGENEYFIESKENALEDLEQLISSAIFPIILDDDIFNKEEQLDKANKLIEYLEEFKEIYKKPWLLRDTIIAVAGKFSAGKTTLINNLLEMGGVLPTNTKAATAVPTYIVPNLMGLKPNKEFLAVTFEGKLKKFNIEILKSLNKDVAKNFIIPISAIIKSFIVPTSGTGNFAVIDTPGYNPGDKHSIYDRESAIESIKIANIIFYVIDIQDGDITNDAVNFIKSVLKGKSDTKLYIVLNKADKKPPKSRIKIKEKIKQTLMNEKIKFESIFLFSSNQGKKIDSETEKDIENLKNLIEELSISKNEISKHALFSYIEDVMAHAMGTSFVYFKALNKIYDVKKSLEKFSDKDLEILGDFKEKIEFLDENLIKNKIDSFSALGTEAKEIIRKVEKIKQQLQFKLVTEN